MKKKSGAAKRAETARRRSRLALGTVKPGQVVTPKKRKPPKHKKPPAEEET